LRKTLNSFRADPKNASALAGFPADAEEQVLFADNLIKVNRYGSRQQRTLIITTIAVLNFKPKVFTEFKRRIPIAFVEELWLVTGTHDLGEWALTTQRQGQRGSQRAGDVGDSSQRKAVVAAVSCIAAKCGRWPCLSGDGPSAAGIPRLPVCDTR